MASARVHLRPAVLVAGLALLSGSGTAQIAEVNINMVSGTEWPGGDPFLRQQNEPSIAVSSRNPLHLLAAANDYRTVDIPFVAAPRPDGEDTGDAWIGIFRSRNGGNTWTSTLLDGYPQQVGSMSIGSISPVKGYQAAADPVVRAGKGGMFYVAGIVLNRGDNPLGALFVARFIDNNNSEVSDPIAYLDTMVLDRGTSGQFIDKPWEAVDPNTNGGQCTVNGQTFPAQNIYVAYSVFLGNDNNIRTKMMFTRSTDCGATWDAPTKLSETFPVNQGASIAVDSLSGTVYVAWRQFGSKTDPDAIILAKSTDQGRTFSKATLVATIVPFDQGTSKASFRTNSYPTVAATAGRLYMAWSQRNANGDARIVMSNSPDGVSWTAPLEVAPIPMDPSQGRGHQFMPSLTVGGGKLTLAWYDLRQDHTIGAYTKSTTFPGFYDEQRALVGNLALGQPSVVFWNFLADMSPDPDLKLVRRHTIEVFAADSEGGLMPTFNVAKVSRYKFGSRPDSDLIQDLQINPPNLPMFRQGSVPFLGDYMDVSAYGNEGAVNAFSSVQSGMAGAQSKPTRIRHIVWSDNRDVRPPLGSPPDWTKYTPVNSSSLGATSKFDPTQQTTPCTDPAVDAPASRNQNIYTARVSDGMFAGSPGNAKPLGTIQRAFAVFVQNARKTVAAYRLSIAQQPLDGTASFLQFSLLPTLDVTIPPRSTATRTVFVTGAPHASVEVNVVEITEAGGTDVPGGLSSVIGLNPDPSNPDIGNPDIGNPDIGNAEVFNPDIGNPDIGNPDIGNPDIGNPDIGNPDIGNPDIGNPDIGNPDIGNPDIGNPDIGNPDIGNPDIGNPDIGNGVVTDTTWTATNEGNTTGGFTVKLLKNGEVPPGFKTQLILHKLYSTPVARDCNLGVEHHRQIIANINNPTFATLEELTDPSLTDPSAKNATMWLAPEESGRITFRVVDPNRSDNITFDAAANISPVVIAQSVNTLDANEGIRVPPIALTITTYRVPDAVLGDDSYNAMLQAVGGVGARSWSAGAGMPPGTTLNSDGSVSGMPTVADDFRFTATVTDSKTPTPNSDSQEIDFRVVMPLLFTTNSFAPATVGAPYSQTLTSSGGTAPIHWTVDSGALPAGITLSDDGILSGTPTAAGTANFVLRLTDSGQPSQSITTGTLSLVVAAVQAVCGSTVFEIFNNSNTGGVANGGTSPSFSTESTYCLDSIWTYHWNDGAGATPGTIGLSTPRGTLGPWNAIGSAGQGGAPNVNWTARPPSDTVVLLSPDTTYTVVDSDPATWSQNSQSNGQGFTIVYARTYTPSNLRFLTQPQDAVSGEQISSGLSVEATDASGALIPGLQVTLSQQTSATCPAGVVSSRIATTNAAGVASFGEVTGMRGCYGGVLTASAPNTTPASSNAFDVFGFGDFPAMNVARGLGVAATRLNDGRILVTGGSGETSLSSAEIYSPITHSWQSLPDMSVGRAFHTATLLPDGDVLIAGGRSSFTTFPTWLEVFRPATNDFFVVDAELSEGRSEHIAVLMPMGEVAFIGGRREFTWVDQIEIYVDGVTIPLDAALSTSRTAHTATLVDDRGVFVIGGGSGVYASTAEIFNGTTMVTADGRPLLARATHTATLLADGTILVVGGLINTPEGPIATRTAEIYDPATELSEYTGAPVNEHFDHVAQILSDGTVVIAGGNRTTSPGFGTSTDAVEMFDPARGTFANFGKLSLARWGMRVVPLDATPGRFLLVGGGGTLVEVFYPPRP